MATLQTRQVIEHFHLAFLDVLGNRMDPSRYVLKGGANLRYFFESLRYSEDIDLDMLEIEPWRLGEKVDAVLDSKALGLLLRRNEIAVADCTKPKQTDTTRRWKVGLEAPGHSDLVRTKIEFSNRNGESRYRLEAVPQRIVAPYAQRPPSVQHYLGPAQTKQKVEALAGRSETQARDVFDLDLLLRLGYLQDAGADEALLVEAASRALELSFDAFRDQVLPFLEDDAFELYDSEEAWDQMQTYVAETLEDAQ